MVEVTKSVSDDISFADGWNINHGKKTYEGVDIKMYVGGKLVESTYQAPHAITKASYGSSYNDLTSKGVYARLGDTYISQKMYDAIMDMLNEATAECDTPEFDEVKAAEIAKEIEREKYFQELDDEQQRLIDGGLCPKCGSYCYGDCEAH